MSQWLLLFVFCSTHWSPGQRYASVSSAFVRTMRVGVCQGPYAKPLVRAWKAWDKKRCSENDPVDVFGAGQVCFEASQQACSLHGCLEGNRKERGCEVIECRVIG